MTAKLNWWWVGGLAVVLSLIGVVALAAGRSGSTTPTRIGGAGTGSGSSSGGSSGSGSGGEPPIELSCLILADGTTVRIGQTLYSAGYTPMVLNPDSKSPIIDSRYSGDVVGTFTGRSHFSPNYFSSGNCFLQVTPSVKGGFATTLPLTLWVHPKHVTAQQPS